MRGIWSAPAIAGRALRRGFVLAFVLVAALGVGALRVLPGAAPAAASEESCPTSPEGGAVLDWGQNIQEQLGLGFHDGHEPQPGTVVGTTATQLSHVRQAQAGFEFTLALMSNCRLETWGANRQGQLGDGHHAKTGQPHDVVTESGPLTEVKQVSVGNSHPIALRYDGSVWTWGAAEFGERGNGESGWERTAKSAEPAIFKPRSVAIPVEGVHTYVEAHSTEAHPANVRQVASGGKVDLAVLENGEVLGWGADPNGWLGVSTSSHCYGELHAVSPEDCVLTPTHIPISKEIERVAAGELSEYAIVRGGNEVLAWGKNTHGQLGIGSTTSTTTPTRVNFTPPSPVVEVSSEGEFALALLANGTVYGWGVDGSGQLGIAPGSECGGSCYTSPVQIGSLGHVVQISAGLGNSIVLKEELSGAKVPYVFGHNGRYSMLGLGNFEDETRTEPVQLKGLPPVESVTTSSSTVAVSLGSAGAPPLVEAKAGNESIKLTWRIKAEGFKLRYRPADAESKAYTQLMLAGCEPEKEACTTETLTGLASEPYEVNLATTTTEGGTTNVAPYRKMTVTPLPPVGAPVNVEAPSVTTTEETPHDYEGQELKAQHGAWEPAAESYKYLWFRCAGLGPGGSDEEFGAECEEIPGASSSTYTPTAEDRGYALSVRVKAENTHGASAADTSPELVLGSEDGEEPPEPPVATAAPSIVGTPLIGAEAKAAHGTWTPGSPETSKPTLEDKWFVCRNRVEEEGGEGVGSGCSEVGAPGSGYTPTEPTGEKETPEQRREHSPIGKWLEIQEHGRNAGGSGESTSEPKKVLAAGPPENIKAPEIEEGLVEIEQTVRLKEGKASGAWGNANNWTGGAESASYQWYRCSGTCTAISGATKKSYQIVSADAGYTLEIAETAHNKYGAEAVAGATTAYSAPTITVPAAGTEPPAHSSVPVISGAAKQGEELTVTRATWTKVTATPTLAWKDCNTAGKECSSIPHTAEKTTYVVQAADVGHKIIVTEHATNSAGSTLAESALLGPIAGEVPLNTAVPNVTGVTQVGQTLTSGNGSWTNPPIPPAELTYAYKWQRCTVLGTECATIAGQTAKTYTLTEADVGSTIRSQATASNETGTGAVATSGASEAVAPLPPTNTGEKPSITPTNPEKGTVLTAHNGGWTPEPTSYTYKWLRCNSAGAACSTISAATGSTYTVEATDVEHTIALQVRASNGPERWNLANSAATEVVPYPTPSVTGVEHAKGPLAGGRRVVVVGHHIGDATAVRFGGAEAISRERVSENEVAAVAPAGSAGAVDITVTTSFGTSATSEADLFTYDEEPSVSSISPTTGKTEGGQWVKVNGADLAEAEKTVYFGLSPAGEVRNVTATSLEAKAPSGGGTVDVTIKSSFGESPTGAGDRFRYVPAPTVTGVSPASGTGGTNVTITGTEFVGSATVKFGGSEATEVVVSSETTIKAKAPAGSGTVAVTVATAYGEATKGSAFTYYPPPTVSSVAPSEGPLTAGESVTIEGAEFLKGPSGEEPTVKFGAASATEVERVSSTKLKVKAPAGAAGSPVDVTVTTAYGTSTTGSADHYTYRALPEVESVSPTKATVGVTLPSVTITGKNFVAGATTVKFEAVEGTSVSVNEAGTSLTVMPPLETPGVIDVYVTTRGGKSAKTSKDHFNYAPEIKAISQNKGSTLGGTSVTIEGAGFATGTVGAGATTVKFGTAEASGSCASSTKCTVTSPPHAAGKVEIAVIVNGSSSPVTSAAKYTYE